MAPRQIQTGRGPAFIGFDQSYAIVHVAKVRVTGSKSNSVASCDHPIPSEETRVFGSLEERGYFCPLFSQADVLCQHRWTQISKDLHRYQGPIPLRPPGCGGQETKHQERIRAADRRSEAKSTTAPKALKPHTPAYSRRREPTHTLLSFAKHQNHRLRDDRHSSCADNPFHSHALFGKKVG